ncbi:V-type ATP synthase subunit I [Enterococcus columbae]|uniref:Uncharacterized protein n=1 Tax=Enterococcus columbae DSM 7374 = ATCC 51263 TaxID=1121865 RepID=S0KL56_9ENTE|nr:V-type ATP synthase subunit I [Enterococcus columbae]EOT39941.1 hypothetical protein OMW_01730 [Enterococcus columbae DSM 7374 = ATCC 51263]EOW83926.1 hypothetical protein I568_01373 [Enterococcus columbae DSM 7374 = ATCC 51263]
MAVTKMKKLTVIAPKNHQASLLKTIQGLQQLQIRDVFVQNVSNQWVKTYFKEVQPVDYQNEIANNQQMVSKINEAIQFILHYGNLKQPKNVLKRQNLSLAELEGLHEHFDLEAELANIQQLQEKWQSIEQNLRKLNEKEQDLFAWQKLDIIPNQFASKQVRLQLATVASENWLAFEQASQQLPELYLELIYDDTKEAHFAMVYLESLAEQVKHFASQFSAVEVHLAIEQTPSQAIKQIDQQVKALVQQQKELALEIGQKRQLIAQLQLSEEYLLAKIERYQALSQFVQTEHLFVLQGWVGQTDCQELTQALQNSVPYEEVYLSFEEPTAAEIQEEVPTKLNNHPIVRPFEMLIEMYSLPKYDEIDPTPWMFPFFLVFFGMMVADIGYGVLMLVATTVALHTQVFKKGTERFLRFFQVVSIPTILWGFIYNSCFGESLPYKPLLSTQEDVIQILLLTVSFGFIQIMVGLALAGYQNVKRNDYLGAITNGFAWQAILVGLAIYAAGTFLNLGTLVGQLGIVIALIGVASIIFIPTFTNKSKVLGFVGGLYQLYGISSYIGDLVSYTRLMALGISGGAIAAAFNLIVGFMPPVFRFTIGLVLLVALHALNIFLSLLGAYVHGARLQYVEFFGKFYEGGGKVFQPLKSAEKHVNIRWKKQNNGGNES